MKKPDILAKLAIAVGLGLLTPFVFIVGAEPFEVPGQNPIGERLSGGVVLALYLAVCQFNLAPKGGAAGATEWSVVVALAMPVLAWADYFLCRDGLGSIWIISLPILAAGVCGVGVGAVLATWWAAKKKAAASAAALNV